MNSITPATPRAVLQIDGAWYQACQPIDQLVARDPGDVVATLRAAEAAAESGYHLVGYVAYEAGAAFGLSCHPPDELPLMWFGIFENLEPYDADGLTAAASMAPAVEWQTTLSEDGHAAAVRHIRERLAAGDTYQTNLTFPLRGPYAGDPFALFARLARSQQASCAAYVDSGRYVICSASPEVFFQRDGDFVATRPMKGTATRGRTLREDNRRASELRRSPKQQAENLMIVDMVRNDLGRVAKPGSVRVPHLFDVETYPTILQMTSTVEAETTASLEELFGAMFPSASVTGAPKVRTAKLIRELEPLPRGVYTGAVGYLGPNRTTRFNVAIRTATVDRNNSEVTYGVGSGIVWDSRAGREYQECLAKARILSTDERPFALLETMRWDPDSGFYLLNRHLRRQAASARYFGIPYDRRQARSVLEESVGGACPLRVRLLVDEHGELEAETRPLAGTSNDLVRIGFARMPVDPTDRYLYHKTTRRDVYERARASRPDCEQVILWNRSGFVSETDIANLAVLRDGQWLTPSGSTGLLPGTLRAELLAAGEVTEASIPRVEIDSTTTIAVLNSVSGWRRARFIPDAGC